MQQTNFKDAQLHYSSQQKYTYPKYILLISKYNITRRGIATRGVDFGVLCQLRTFGTGCFRLKSILYGWSLHWARPLRIASGVGPFSIYSEVQYFLTFSLWIDTKSTVDALCSISILKQCVGFEIYVWNEFYVRQCFIILF